jgi:hypothetical protein
MLYYSVATTTIPISFTTFYFTNYLASNFQFLAMHMATRIKIHFQILRVIASCPQWDVAKSDSAGKEANSPFNFFPFHCWTVNKQASKILHHVDKSNCRSDRLTREGTWILNDIIQDYEELPLPVQILYKKKNTTDNFLSFYYSSQTYILVKINLKYLVTIP